MTGVQTCALPISVGITVLAFLNSIERQELTGALLAVWALGSATAAIFNGVIKWQMNHAQLFTYSLAFMLFASFALLMVDNVWQLALVLYLNGIGISPVLVNAYATMESEVSTEELTEAMTWVTTGTPTGGALGSAVAGQIIDSFGASRGFWIPIAALIIANLALLPYLKVWLRLRSRS